LDRIRAGGSGADLEVARTSLSWVATPTQPAAAATGLAAPEFTILGATPAAGAAAPALDFTLAVSDPAAGEVFAIAVTAQIQIESEISGDDPLLWARADVLVPTFHGSTHFMAQIPCTYDLGLATVRRLRSMRAGTVGLTFHFSGRVLRRAVDRGVDLAEIPAGTRAHWNMPVSVWERAIRRHYPHGGWIPVREDTAEALQRLSAARGQSFDALLTDLLAGR
jgi:hypothetical protein